MKDSLESAPELVFGLVAPIGVDLNIVVDVLTRELGEMEYVSHLLKLTDLMTEMDVGLAHPPNAPFIQSYKEKIGYANKIREAFGDDALAALAISGIRSFRRAETTTKVEKLTAKKSVTHSLWEMCLLTLPRS